MTPEVSLVSGTKYLTQSGKVGLEIREHRSAAGDTWYSYTGAWGAGSTYDVAHMRRIIGDLVRRKRGVRMVAPGALAAKNPVASREGARRSDAIPYEDLLDVADVAQHWYDGQRDPVYALVSSTFAGHDTPLSIAEDALYNLNKDYRRSNDAELGEAVGQLEWAILETRSKAARMPNPLSMGSGEKVAIGVGLVAGVAALAYYTAQALGIGIAKAVGSATPSS